MHFIYCLLQSILFKSNLDSCDCLYWTLEILEVLGGNETVYVETVRCVHASPYVFFFSILHAFTVFCQSCITFHICAPVYMVLCCCVWATAWAVCNAANGIKLLLMCHDLIQFLWHFYSRSKVALFSSRKSSRLHAMSYGKWTLVCSTQLTDCTFRNLSSVQYSVSVLIYEAQFLKLQTYRSMTSRIESLVFVLRNLPSPWNLVYLYLSSIVGIDRFSVSRKCNVVLTNLIPSDSSFQCFVPIFLLWQLSVLAAVYDT